MVTGHSMGGAMASFCGLDLVVNPGYDNVQVTIFGQPRTGNAAFVSYYNHYVPNTIRVVNDHDMVPHMPPYYSHFTHNTYHHVPREVWQWHIGYGSLVYSVEKACDGSGEDPTCCSSVYGKSISDLTMCSTEDHYGNFVLSNYVSSVLEMKKEPAGRKFVSNLFFSSLFGAFKSCVSSQ